MTYTCRWVRLVLVVLLVHGLAFVLLDARVARAELVTTEAALAGASGVRDQVRALLARDEVTRELRELGIDPAQARDRVEALSDAELAVIAGRLDQLPAGGSAVGAIVTALLIVFIILLITDIAGVTDVFPFVKKPEERRQSGAS